MTTMEREAIAAVCLFAAWADGVQSDVEREAIRRALDEMGPISDAVFQRVAMKRTTIEEEASRILDSANRDAAFEMAVGVCCADGAATSAEKTFLQRLAIILQINQDKAKEMIAKADEMAGMAQAAPVNGVTPPPLPSGVSALAGDAAVTKQVDDVIMTYAAINAGLELLPQSLATFGIVPLQARMVYKVGSLYGYKLDSGHIKEFVATVGLGMGGQFVESYARKALGGIVGKLLGKTMGKVAPKTTGPVITFATTYALGQVAKSYYSSGRKLSMSALQQQFSKVFEDAKTLYSQKVPEIRAQAGKLEPGKLLNLVRGA